MTMTEASMIVTITNELGLHARPVVFQNSSERLCGLLLAVAQDSPESLAPDDRARSMR